MIIIHIEMIIFLSILLDKEIFDHMCIIFIYYFNLFIFFIVQLIKKLLIKTHTYATKISKRIIDFELIWRLLEELLEDYYFKIIEKML